MLTATKAEVRLAQSCHGEVQEAYDCCFQEERQTRRVRPSRILFGPERRGGRTANLYEYSETGCLGLRSQAQIMAA